MPWQYVPRINPQKQETPYFNAFFDVIYSAQKYAE